jgi:hypothetical protein
MPQSIGIFSKMSENGYLQVVSLGVILSADVHPRRVGELTNRPRKDEYANRKSIEPV